VTVDDEDHAMLRQWQRELQSDVDDLSSMLRDWIPQQDHATDIEDSLRALGYNRVEREAIRHSNDRTRKRPRRHWRILGVLATPDGLCGRQ
jgi:hypothetical protein